MTTNPGAAHRMAQRIASLLCAALFLSSIAFAQPELSVSRLRKPPEEFLAFGDVVGVSPGLLQRLGIEEDDPVEVETPAGRRFAFRTKVHGTIDTDLYAKKTIRDTMHVADGAIALKVRVPRWGSGPDQTVKLAFTTVSRPPVAFLDYGDAVGIGAEKLRAAAGYPGMMGRITGPAGSREVVVELLDRGPDTIAMKGTLRTAIGVADGPASVTLEVFPAAEQKTRPVFWYKTLAEAAAGANEDRRPILLYACDDGAACKNVEALFTDAAVNAALRRTRKYRFRAADDPATTQRFNVTAAPTIVLVTPTGKQIGRWTGEVDRGKLLAGIRLAGETVRAQSAPPAATED